MGFSYHGVTGTLDVKPGDHEMEIETLPLQIRDGELHYFE